MALSKSFSQFLKSIGVHSSIEEVQSNLEKLKIQADDAKTPINSKAVLETVQDLEAQISSLSYQIGSIAFALERYEQHADLQVPSFISTIVAGITDYYSAYNATLTYDRVWFSNLLMSGDAKSTLAQGVLQEVLKYTKDNTETLSMIANHDPVLMTVIATPITNGDV